MSMRTKQLIIAGLGVAFLISLILVQAGGAGDVETQLHPRLGAILVLAAWAAAPRGAELYLGEGDGESIGDGDSSARLSVFIRSHRIASPETQRGQFGRLSLPQLEEPVVQDRQGHDQLLGSLPQPVPCDAIGVDPE